MKLEVTAGSATHGEMVYCIQADVPRSSRTKNGHPPKKTRKLVEAQAPRIGAMAKKLLGRNFLRVETGRGIGWVFLYVKQGTSRGDKKFELRMLLGWMSLCTMET
jgi:hypothetical protein